MWIYGGQVFTGGGFEPLDIRIEGETIAQVAPVGSRPAGAPGLNAAGCTVLPGFVDVHTHGAAGYDFCDADPEGLGAMLRFWGGQGVTSVVPATLSLPKERLAAAIRAGLPFVGKGGHGAVMRGVNLEGPFFSQAMRGAQNPDYIIPPDWAFFEELYAVSEGAIRMVDLAPELPGALDFIRRASKLCTVSIAHTSANYEEAAAAFEAGATHATHLYNAMPPYDNFEPGAVGAVVDYAKEAELICDGFHIHPTLVRSIFRDMGAGRVCLISDSMRATGMPEGDWDLGGKTARVQGGRAVLVDEHFSLAGSVTHLADMCRRAIGFGVPMAQAVAAATVVPARSVGLAGLVGSLSPGLRADAVLWEEETLATRAVVCGGQLLPLPQ